MNKQTILIYDFDTLFDILTEIKQNLKFDILKAKTEKELSDIDKNNLGAYNNLGASLQQLRRFEQAVKVYEKVLSFKPDFTDALNNLATCFANLKKYDQAISYFEKILKINKNNSVVYNNLGNIYKEINFLRIFFHLLEVY